MPTVRILQTGDLHLETPFSGSCLTREQARQRREELRETFTRIIGLVQERGVQLLLIAGDLFEHRYATKDTMRFLNRQFAAIPATKVFIVPGNHDPALADSYYRTFPWNGNVHIFTEPEFTSVSIPELNCCVHGFGWTRWEDRENRLSSLRIGNRDCLNLVLLHGDAAGAEGETIYLPVTAAAMQNCGADYIALGHIHNPMPVKAGGKVLGQYAGSPEPLNFGETGEHGVLTGELEKGNIKMEFVPTARRQYRHLTVPVTPELDAEALLGLCREQIAVCGADHYYRCTLTGLADPEVPLDLNWLTEKAREACFYAEMVNETRPDQDLEAIAAQEGNSVIGQFITRMLGMMDKSAGEERETARRALERGLGALTRKKVG